jgi:hypothetical protein
MSQSTAPSRGASEGMRHGCPCADPSTRGPVEQARQPLDLGRVLAPVAQHAGQPGDPAGAVRVACAGADRRGPPQGARRRPARPGRPARVAHLVRAALGPRVARRVVGGPRASGRSAGPSRRRAARRRAAPPPRRRRSAPRSRRPRAPPRGAARRRRRGSRAVVGERDDVRRRRLEARVAGGGAPTSAERNDAHLGQCRTDRLRRPVGRRVVDEHDLGPLGQREVPGERLGQQLAAVVRGDDDGEHTRAPARRVAAQSRMAGNSTTSRIDCEPVSSITSRSIPMPIPPVGGIPCSSAARNASSIGCASSSPSAA